MPAPGNHDAEGGGSMSARVPPGGTSRRCGVGTLGSTGVSRGLLPGEPGWSRGSTEIQQRTALWTLGPLSGASEGSVDRVPPGVPESGGPEKPVRPGHLHGQTPKGKLVCESEWRAWPRPRWAVRSRGPRALPTLPPGPRALGGAGLRGPLLPPAPAPGPQARQRPSELGPAQPRPDVSTEQPASPRLSHAR